jgi:molecular chaperone DnaK
MSEQIFGLDFGTTNSLAAIVIGGEVKALRDSSHERPHPSVVWYRGSDVIVGREARNHLENLEGGAEQGFVRSPKMALRRPGPLHVGGRRIEPVDVVAEVLRHIRNAAYVSTGSYDITQAVMTVPVDFAGLERRALRDAARKAGIGVFQFVHGPVAALYAFLRSRPDFERYIAELENRVALVFDWGGGTLDLTLCRVMAGSLMQILSRGNNEIGGDRFDEKLRNCVRDKHFRKHHIDDMARREQPGSLAALLTRCELAKIELSSRDRHTIIVKDYLRGSGQERNLGEDLSRNELEELSKKLVSKGLAEIDEILETAGLQRHDVELCLATGGMVNMPAIRHGLVERFGGRFSPLSRSDSIIAEGAAWIAHDRLRLKLAKPIEVLVADGSGRGSYLPVVSNGLTLPIENQTIPVPNRRFFCTDPRDGMAVFEFLKPRKVGNVQPSDQRETICVMNLPVDPHARPLLERIECTLQIDHDYVAHATLRSNGRGAEVSAEFHQLDFALALPVTAESSHEQAEKKLQISKSNNSNVSTKSTEGMRRSITLNISIRSNIRKVSIGPWFQEI